MSSGKTIFFKILSGLPTIGNWAKANQKSLDADFVMSLFVVENMEYTTETRITSFI